MSECLEHQGMRNRDGYGVICVGHGRKGRRNMLAHRWMWTQINGAIPEGLIICHHCDNPPCINPEHLFMGTIQDNIADKVAKGRAKNQNSDKTHCKYGHALEGDNIYSNDGRRRCRECRRRERRERNMVTA